MNNKQAALFLTPKASYYNSKEEIVKEGADLHQSLFKKDRALYAYLLYFKNATYYSKSLIIRNLLENSLHKTENQSMLSEDSLLLKIEDALIHYALFNESMTHALKLLLSLKKGKVNNRRTSKVILRFLFERGNADYISIKYKQKIKDLLIHALGYSISNKIANGTEEGKKFFKKYIEGFENPYAMEIIRFVFNKKNNVDGREFSSSYLKEYLDVQRQFNESNVNINKETRIPIEVLKGFDKNNKYNIVSLLSMGNVSEKQKIQMSNVVKRSSPQEKVKMDIDFTKYSIIDLYKYLYSQTELDKYEAAMIFEIIKDKAIELRNQMQFGTNEASAIILDLSDSNFGSKDMPLHPLYRNLMLQNVLTRPDDKVFLVGGVETEYILHRPYGDTNLSAALLDAVEEGFKNILILSDGFENVGSFEDVHDQLLKIGYDLKCTHFNPVFSPKNFSFKTISDSVPTIPFQTEKDIPYLNLFYLLNQDEEQFKKVIREKIVTELAIQ